VPPARAEARTAADPASTQVKLILDAVRTAAPGGVNQDSGLRNQH